MTSVLIVDDDQMFARAVGRVLEDQGFVVSILESVAQALPALAANRIDVLLADLRLGPQDGIDLLESLRRVAPRTRAVLMSGYATARDYQRAIELGAVRVLCKPFTPTELIQCIRQAVECETGFHGSVHGLSLVDMLQMFNYGRRSVTVTVAAARPGRLHLRDGQVVHAEHESTVGEQAVRSILALPTGTLSTSALATTDQSVTREFREVLLDALRSIDEEASPDSDIDEAFDLFESGGPPPVVTPMLTPQEEMLLRIREIDGYVAACLVLLANGGVLNCHGSLDSRPAGALTAELVRRSRKTVADMGLVDDTEDVLITGSERYHLFRPLRSEVEAFVYLVLDRKVANPAMAKRALASAAGAINL